MMEADNKKKLSNMLWFLGFAFLFGFYIFTTGLDLIKGNFCGNTAIDYCAYWSTGEIINDEGFAKIYDLKILEEHQSAIYPRPIKNSDYFQIIPFPYLSIFALPFALLSKLSLKTSYIVWVAINAIALVLYLRFFIRQTISEKIQIPMMAVLLVSVPVFLNLSYGQLNIWLGIFAGEFVRNLIKKRPIFAGIWLAGLLLKPQTLILVLPFLLFTKEFRVLIGFAVNSGILITGSFLLGGVEGALGWYKILIGSSAGRSAANPLVMMNWRMLSMHINNFTHTSLGTYFLVVGVAATLTILYLILRKLTLETPTVIAMRYLSIFVATMLVTWHAHFSQGLVFYPLLIIFVTNKTMADREFKFWLIFPIIIMLLIFFLPVVTFLLNTNSVQINFLKLLSGIRGLILNIWLLLWAFRQTKSLQFGSGYARDEKTI
jgi:hypothetical protein